jgi:hypothetical protein
LSIAAIWRTPSRKRMRDYQRCPFPANPPGADGHVKAIGGESRDIHQ